MCVKQFKTYIHIRDQNLQCLQLDIAKPIKQQLKRRLPTKFGSSIGGGMGELCRCDAKCLVTGIVDAVESFEEGVPVDKIESAARNTAHVAHDEVDGIGYSTNFSIQL